MKRKWICWGLVGIAVAGHAQNSPDTTNRTDGTRNTGLVSPVNRQAGKPALLLNAHAHNDYEHARPLLDALDAGFCSVEADVWLVNGQLLVAHDRERVKPERTLEALYLEPLRERIRANGGRVFANVATVTLMIDVKSEAVPTYEALRAVLGKYREMLSEFSGTNWTARAVTVVLTGNRATEMVEGEQLRYVAVDGRLADLDGNLSSNLVPLISDNWKQFFQWRGQDAFPEEERVKLKQWALRAHQQGRRLRFWGAPDNAAGWEELRAAGVDLISTDDLNGLAKFFSAE